MRIIKNICRKVFSIFGYELLRLSQDRLYYNNFLNLVKAYEHCLNKSQNLIPPNERRPKLLARLLGTSPAEAYFIIQSLVKTKDINGSVCEFGVAQGETSALIANEILSSDKIFHLFDSFQGLPKSSRKDQLKDDIFSLGSIERYAGTMSCPEKMVRARLKALSFPLNRFIIHRGFFDQVLRGDVNLPQKVSFAYVDFDLYEPIKQTLNFLHNITLPGAIIIIDDYDFFSTGVKTAVDEFLKERNLSNIVYKCLIPDKIPYGCLAVLTKV